MANTSSPVPEAEFRFIWYGSGDWAQEIDKTEKVGDDGRDGFEFIINPGRKISQKYNLKLGQELDANTGLMKRWYPKSHVFILNDSQVSGRVLIGTDFLGRDTSFSRKEAYFTEQIDDLQKQVRILKAEKARWMEELFRSQALTRIYIEKTSDMILAARKAAKRDQTPEDQGMMDQEGGE